MWVPGSGRRCGQAGGQSGNTQGGPGGSGGSSALYSQGEGKPPD